MPDPAPSPGRARPSRVSGSLALDFANTVSGRGTPFRRDHIAGIDDLTRWFADAGLVPAAAPDAGEDAGLFATALDLREAIDSVIRPMTKGHGAPDRALSRLRDHLAALLGRLRLVPGPDGRLRWVQAPAPADAAAALALVAMTATDLVRTTPPGRLKHCPGADCGWLFLDATKNASRRWCDMGVCGNRTKARRFRGRLAIRPPGR